MKCEFSVEDGDSEKVTIGEVVVPRVRKFWYLGSTIEERGDIDEDINHRIRAGWQHGGILPEYCVTRKFL